jgi:hypothetical protein
MDIKKVDSKTVEVEYFDGAINSYNYAQRKVVFPHKNNSWGAYINWFGEKKIVESVFN